MSLFILPLTILGFIAQTACESTYQRNAESAQSAKSQYLGCLASQKPNGGAFIPGNGRKINSEQYESIKENRFLTLAEAARSTFSVDVDTASYANVRRMITKGGKVPKDAVRIEEMINYFDYQYPAPNGEHPFSVNDEVSTCPWAPKHQLVRIGIKGRDIDSKTRKKANLVFLIDVSGSMRGDAKLPLLKKSLTLLTTQLRHDDRIAIVTYSGSTGVALPSTPCSESDKIVKALDQLNAAGSTAGGEGLVTAYKVAKKNFIRGGVNRVILATDGDFNVGATSDEALGELIEEQAKSRVYLSVLGFGMGNLNDAMMEQLSAKGNGNYAYIDTINEAKKVLVQELNSSITTIAKDVKLQVEFNPRHVQAYRLIGYENRALEDKDFNDDKKDAGEIGAGHQITALYEIVPPGVKFGAGINPLKYRQNQASENHQTSDELMTVSLRYKPPTSDRSRATTHIVQADCGPFAKATGDFKFASAVAAYGMLLKDSDYSGSATRIKVLDWANSGKGKDEFGYRKEFVKLVKLEKK